MDRNISELWQNILSEIVAVTPAGVWLDIQHNYFFKPIRHKIFERNVFADNSDVSVSPVVIGGKEVSIWRHKKEIPTGTAEKILKKMGIK